MAQMAEETIDGLTFGLRLMAMPGVMERRNKFWDRVAKIKHSVQGCSKEQLVKALKQSWDVYIEELLEKMSHADLIDKVTMTIANTKDGDRLREILQLPYVPKEY